MLPEKLMLFIIQINSMRWSWGYGKELRANHCAMVAVLVSV